MHDQRMKKILSKKRDLSPMEHSAKMDVVKQMRDMASEEMGGKLDGLKKVSVTSNSPEGLKKGLDKAKEIVSSPEMEDMKNEAENDYGDYKSALDEHSDDEPNDQEDFTHQDGDDGHDYAEGGQVQSEAEKAQESMRKAFGYNEGGQVDPDESDEDESEESSESPEFEAGEQEGEDEFEGLDVDALKEKLREMMQMHKSMGKK